MVFFVVSWQTSAKPFHCLHSSAANEKVSRRMIALLYHTQWRMPSPCLLCSQFSPYLVLDVTLSTALSTHRERAFLEIHRPSCLACSGSFVCSHCLLICGETDTGTDTDALEWSRLASELLKRGSVQWSSVRSSIRHSFSQLPGLFSNATACLPMQRANKA